MSDSDTDREGALARRKRRPTTMGRAPGSGGLSVGFRGREVKKRYGQMMPWRGGNAKQRK